MTTITSQPTTAAEYQAEWVAIQSTITHAAACQARALRSVGEHSAAAATLDGANTALAALLGMSRIAHRVGH